MNALLPFLAVLLAGVGLAVQAPTNAALAQTGGSVTLAALVSFAIGLALLLLAWGLGDRTPLTSLRGAPAWAWFGGVYGAGYVAALAFGAPRLGLATTVTIVIAGQLATALVLDHLGLLGLHVATVSVGKIAGTLLVLAGVVLVRRAS